MADAVLSFQASDLFAMPAQFKEQRSSTTVTRERDINLDADGDVSCESEAFNLTTNYSNDFQYCGSALSTDAGVFLSTFGEVQDSKAVTGASIDFSNKEQPSVSVEGHNHAVAAHDTSPALRTYNISTIIPAAGGVGVPTIAGVTVAATNAIQSAGFSIAVEHMDTENADGDHFAGQNRTCRVDLNLSGVGPASGITIAGTWKIDDLGDEDGNTDPDSFSISCHQYVAKN